MQGTTVTAEKNVNTFQILDYLYEEIDYSKVNLLVLSLLINFISFIYRIYDFYLQ